MIAVAKRLWAWVNDQPYVPPDTSKRKSAGETYEPVPPAMRTGRMTGNPDAVYQPMARFLSIMCVGLLGLVFTLASALIIVVSRKETDVKVIQSLENNERWVRVSTVERSQSARRFVERQFCVLYARLREEVSINKAENARRWDRGGELTRLHSQGVDTVFRASRDYFDLREQFEANNQYRYLDILSVRGPDRGQCTIQFRATDLTAAGREIRTQPFEVSIFLGTRGPDYVAAPEDADINPFGLLVIDYARRRISL